MAAQDTFFVTSARQTAGAITRYGSLRTAFGAPGLAPRRFEWVLRRLDERRHPPSGSRRDIGELDVQPTRSRVLHEPPQRERAAQVDASDAAEVDDETIGVAVFGQNLDERILEDIRAAKPEDAGRS